VWDKLGQNVLVDVNTFDVIGLDPLDVEVQLAISGRNLIEMIVPILVVGEVRCDVPIVPEPTVTGWVTRVIVLLFTHELITVLSRLLNA
jgi:hypothetical protein